MKLRALLSRLEPYEWEPPDEEIARRYGLKPEEIHRFDMNTMPYVPESWMGELRERLMSIKVNRYPDTTYRELRERLSDYTGIGIDGIVMANGGDEALDIIFKALLDPGDRVITSIPTYSMIGISAELNHGSVKGVMRLEGFDDDLDGILESIDGRAKAVVLCSPNNPTANSSKRETVLRLLDTGIAVVIDEAYYEFSGKTFADLIKDYENLIIIRTFSKAFCLAGARVAYILTAERTARELNKVRPPNSLSVISIELAKIAMDNMDAMRRYVKEMIEERERCRRELSRLDRVYPYPSETNFLLVRFDGMDSTEIHEDLMSRGLVVRDMKGMPMLDGCIRFNVASREEDDLLISAIGEIVRRA